jgi:hypothetical protein
LAVNIVSSGVIDEMREFSSLNEIANRFRLFPLQQDMQSEANFLFAEYDVCFKF